MTVCVGSRSRGLRCSELAVAMPVNSWEITVCWFYPLGCVTACLPSLGRSLRAEPSGVTSDTSLSRGDGEKGSEENSRATSGRLSPSARARAADPEAVKVGLGIRGRLGLPVACVYGCLSPAAGAQCRRTHSEPWPEPPGHETETCLHALGPEGRVTGGDTAGTL